MSSDNASLLKAVLKIQNNRPKRRVSEVRHHDDEYLNLYWGKVIELNACIAQSIHPDFMFMFDEQNKAAVIIFNGLGPIFELGAGETDAGKLTKTMRALSAALKGLKISRDKLLEVPPPADLHVKGIISEKEKEIVRLSALKRFYSTQKNERTSKANERALHVALGLRCAFERYSPEKLAVSKASNHLTSPFAIALKDVFQVIGMNSDAFEPARRARNVPDDDPDYLEFKRLFAQKFEPETEFPYEWDEVSFDYIETNQ